MDEKDLRITFGMVFKESCKIAASHWDSEKETVDELVQDVEYLATKLFDVAISGQEVVVSDYAHLITEKPKKSYSGGSGGGSYSRGSGGKSSAKAGPGPATAKQIGLATRLLAEKPGVVDHEPHELAEMSKQELSNVIDTLINA